MFFPLQISNISTAATTASTTVYDLTNSTTTLEDNSSSSSSSSSFYRCHESFEEYRHVMTSASFWLDGVLILVREDGCLKNIMLGKRL